MAGTILDYRIPDECRGTILEAIVRDKLHEVTGAKEKWPEPAIRMALERAPEVRSLTKALLRRKPAIIAEIKRASPSAGLLRKDFDPTWIAEQYESAGAAAISVVTEEKHFQGNIETIAGLRWRTRLPLLRKDFIVDSYQLYESRHAGADAVLLIVAILAPDLLRSLLSCTRGLGMEALVEVHTESELDKALEAGAEIIGVNNRDLRSMTVSLDISRNLARRIPENVVAVTESGISGTEDIARLLEAGYRGFLIGESLMRSTSPANKLAELVRRGSSVSSRFS